MTQKKRVSKIYALGDYLKSRIMGQDDVINNYIEKMEYAELGITDPRRPRACFFLLGPTGTGKTELVRETVAYLTGSSDNMLRINMSELGPTAGSDVGKRLIGSSSGDPGRLYNYLEKGAKGTILYDEFEKAHVDMAKYMLQQLDAGQITLYNNKTYDLSQFYLYYTSNVAANIFQGNKNLPMIRKMEAAVNELRNKFSPEFIARFGALNYGILAFKSLTPEVLRQIAKKFTSDSLQRFHNIKETSPEHPDNMHILGYSQNFLEAALLKTNTVKNGAREIRDIVERMIYHAYRELFTIENIGQDRTGYLDIIIRKGNNGTDEYIPIFKTGEPENCIPLN